MSAELATITAPTVTLRRFARAVAVVAEDARVAVHDGHVAVGGRNGSNTVQIDTSLPAETNLETTVSIDAVGLADALATLDLDTEATLTLTGEDYTLAAGRYRYEAPTLDHTPTIDPSSVEYDEAASLACPADILRAVIDYADTVGDSVSFVMDSKEQSLRAEIDGSLEGGTAHLNAPDVAVEDYRDATSMYSVDLLTELVNAMGGVSARCTARFADTMPLTVSWSDGPVAYEWILAPREGEGS